MFSNQPAILLIYNNKAIYFIVGSLYFYLIIKMKTLNINGVKTKRDVGLEIVKLEPSTLIPGSKSKGEVNIRIDEDVYNNCFTYYISMSKKTYRYSETYICNETGYKIFNSEKKCIEHLIHLKEN